jgi:hypothetical protein
MFRAASRLRALEHSSGEPLGMVADLSAGGLRLLTEQALEAGRIYRLDIEVPAGGGRFRLLELVLICQWVKRNPRLNRFEQGLALSEQVPGFAPLVESLKLAEERARR